MYQVQKMINGKWAWFHSSQIFSSAWSSFIRHRARGERVRFIANRKA